MRANQNYIILNSINIGDAEFVLGFNAKAPSRFVTWECKNEKDYFFGHYFNDQVKAQKDLCVRGLNEAQIIERKNKAKSEDMER